MGSLLLAEIFPSTRGVVVNTGQAWFLLLLGLLSITAKNEFMNLTRVGDVEKVYLQSHLGVREVKGHQIFRFTHVYIEL